MIGGNVDHDDYTNHEVEFHSIFGNNFGLKSLPKHGPAFTSVEKNKIRQDKGTFDVIFYLVATLFKASLGRFMFSIIFFKLGQFKDQNDIGIHYLCLFKVNRLVLLRFGVICDSCSFFK